MRDQQVSVQPSQPPSVMQSSMGVFMTNSRASQVPEETIAFIYDIPKKDELFTNKTMTEYFTSKGFKGCTVQIIKDKSVNTPEKVGQVSDSGSKPYWSGRIKFKNAAYLKKAYKDLKYFEMEGF